jgi:DNA repair protein RadC
MKLATAARKKPTFTHRIVAATVVSECLLPYNTRIADTPDKLFDFWNSVVAAEPDHEPDKESVVVVMMNTRLKPMAWNRVTLGTVNESACHPREIFRPVIATGAYGFVLMHNHPSGDPSPSRADEQITRRIREAAELMQIRFIDHLVIGQPSPGRQAWFSFREAGLIS